MLRLTYSTDIVLKILVLKTVFLSYIWRIVLHHIVDEAKEKQKEIIFTITLINAWLAWQYYLKLLDMQIISVFFATAINYVHLSLF